MSIVNKAYQDLQKAILEKQAAWERQIELQKKNTNINLSSSSVPLINQVKIDVAIDSYKKWILELMELLLTHQSALKLDIDKLTEHLDNETVKRWMNEALSFNEDYFIIFSRELAISEWMPHFLAEHAIRPYLRIVADTYKEELARANHMGSCPCCGEPVRLAQLEGKVGKKVIHCPRCYAAWQEKRTMCSHCGKNQDEKMTYLQLENDPTMQLYVCNDCNGYVKVIDVKERLIEKDPALLDLNTIHLDILAQERGYGVTMVNKGSVH